MYIPVTVLSSNLTVASYTITLLLSNSLGRNALTTKAVSVSTSPAVPSLRIIGPSYQSIETSSPLTILSAATHSSCAPKVTAVKYPWSVQTGTPSTSRDPSKFSVPPYSFAVDSTYIVTITASVGPLSTSTSASVTVHVAKGPVTAAVIGGYTRSVPLDQDLVLNASIITNADTRPGVKSSLNYQWSCSISSPKNYGADCNIFGSATSTSNTIRILQNTMSTASIYAFIVIVRSDDGCSDSRTVGQSL